MGGLRARPPAPQEMPEVVYESVQAQRWGAWATLRSRFHKDNLRHLSRFSDLFVTLRILSAPPKTRESAKVHKQTNLSENRGVGEWNVHHKSFMGSGYVPQELIKLNRRSKGGKLKS